MRRTRISGQQIKFQRMRSETPSAEKFANFSHGGLVYAFTQICKQATRAALVSDLRGSSDKRMECPNSTLFLLGHTLDFTLYL